MHAANQYLTSPHALRAGSRAAADNSWALVDVSLLVLTIMVSSDMLNRLSPIAPATWLLCYGLTLLRVGMLGPVFFDVVVRNRVVFAYPAVCLASVLWSVSPATTLVAAVQLTMTVLIATFLGWRYSMVAITKALVIVLAFAVSLSLVHWASGIFPWKVYSNAGGLVGMFTQKNMLGQRALFAVIAILAIWLMPRSQVSVRFKLTALLILLLTLLALFLSKSMTSVLLTPPLAGLLALICVRRIPALITLGLAGLVLAAFAFGPVLLSVAGVDLVDTILKGVGKDSTLTGRTVIWQMGTNVWSQNMPLGVGYGAFWKASEFANQHMLAQEFGEAVTAFHNFVIEILVATGITGVVAMFAIIGTATVRLTRVYWANGSVGAACGLVLLLGSLFASLLGPSLYRPHEFMLVLLVMYMVSAGEETRVR